MGATMRKLGVLVEKDVKDLVKNPTMLLSIIMPVGFTFLYRMFFGEDALSGGDAEVGAALRYVLLSLGMGMSVGMGASMVLIYGIAEEKEKHTLRTLMLANVSAEQIIAAKGLVALALTVLAELACFGVAGAPWSLCAPYLACGIAAAVPMILLSLVAGLASRDQMTAGLYSVPILLLALAPMFGYDESIRSVVRFGPTGGADELLRLMLNGNLSLASAAVPLAVIAGWVLVSAIAFKLLYKRLIRDN